MNVCQAHGTNSEELILSGTYQCIGGGNGHYLDFRHWIAVKHFRALQRPSIRLTVVDCFTGLIKVQRFNFRHELVI